MRKFNTEGPVVARDHYCIPPLERLNLPSILELIGDKRYFVLHAPRQTGKTSVLLALRDLLNSGAGDFRCVYVNVEAAQAVREDVRRAMQVILGELASRARAAGDEFLYDAWPDILATFGLDVARLLGAFQSFFREHSEHWLGRFDYAEAGPQLILQAFLQRVVNGGGRIEREYGLGRGRTDLLIVWPRTGTAAPEAGVDKFVIECKVAHKGLERTIDEGMAQTAACMDRCAARTGHLVVFDRRPDRSWDEKIFRRNVPRDGRPITVWGT